MQLIEFDLDLYNYLLINNERFFLLKINENNYYLIQDKCPHRGGPLHLGEFCPRQKNIICPWHQNTISWGYLSKHSIPLIRRGKKITVLLRTNHATVLLLKRTVYATSSADHGMITSLIK